MAVYLNTYETWQAYGGPEEGGWWYKCGTPVQSIKVSDENLDALYEEREKKTDRLNQLWLRLALCFRDKLCPEAKKKRLERMMDKIEEQKQKLWTSGRLPELNRQASEINKAFADSRPIELKCKETGGYSFVVSSPDDEDPMPSAYYGDQKYETNVEDDFAQPFPARRPHYE